MRNYIRPLHIKLNTHPVGLVALVLAILLLITPILKAAEFSDVMDNWARPQIAHLNTIGLCSGYQDGGFRPYSDISRAEFTKLLINALGYGEEAAQLKTAVSSYGDVDFSYWGKAYIQIADELGLALKKGESFEPEKSISREEAALILSWVLESDEEKLDNDQWPFSDGEEISEQVQRGIKSLYQQGIIKGYLDGSFRPEHNLSRAEATVMIARLMERKGLLFQFSGIIKKAGGRSVQIVVNGKNRNFTLASDAIFSDGHRIMNSLEEVINTRVSFNINEKGEIIFAQLHYEDKYLNLNVLQLGDLPSSTVALAEDGLEEQLDDEPTITKTENKPDTNTSISSPQGEGTVWLAEEPGLGLDLARGITRVDELSSEHGLSGEGVVIAIIDSGIDLRHPDLRNTSSNSPKILDWVNFTDEGQVKTPYIASSNGEAFLSTEFGPVELPRLKSLSGQYRYGAWQEEWITTTQSLDFNGNGVNDDEILVLLIDSKEAGVYDTVFVDTNGNLSLLDEMPLRVYRDHKNSYASFPVSAALPQGFSFILSDIARDGSLVSFGYDSLGHGTHVAGIAAAQGKIKGVAPDASLMAVKVVDSSGITRIENIVKGIKYALQQGANVINISLGQYLQDESDWEKVQEQINRLAGDRAVLVAASGNAGPGIASLSTPGDIDNIISVGAYMAPELAELDYSWETRADGRWYFSSNGPSQNGSWKPDLLAPGAVVSCYPTWKESSYYLDQGTSMAAPFVSGISALLMEGRWVQGKALNSHMIKTALNQGAEALAGYDLIEQGHGLVDAWSSWEYLQQNQDSARSKVLEKRVGLFEEAQGVYSRSLTPGIVTLEAINWGKDSLFVEWISDSDWLKPEQEKTQIAAESKRNLNILYDIPAEPGLYTGILQGLAENMPYNKVELLNTIIVPIELDKNHPYLDYNTLAQGQIKRYYFRVPEGSDSLGLKLKILGTMANLQGRARMHIYDPQGQEYQVSDFVGRGSAGSIREDEIIADRPEPGTWEAVVYSSATLAQYNLKQSDYVLSLELEQSKLIEKEYKNLDLTIGCVYPLKAEKTGVIQLNVLDNDQQPYNGRLLINNKLYEVKEGKVKVFPSFEHNGLGLTIQRVL